MGHCVAAVRRVELNLEKTQVIVHVVPLRVDSCFLDVDFLGACIIRNVDFAFAPAKKSGFGGYGSFAAYVAATAALDFPVGIKKVEPSLRRKLQVLVRH
jgi:hypothetical protein